MKRRLTFPVVVALVVTGLFAVLIIVLSILDRREVTTSLLSPDKRLRAVLLDRPHSSAIDRNFEVRIEEAGAAPRTVWMSPDESPLGIGTERFLWSSDSKRLLVVGKTFWVRKGVELADGESLYFLYDVPSGQVWCNSDSEGPPFGPQELAGHDFGESLTLRPLSESSGRAGN